MKRAATQSSKTAVEDSGSVVVARSCFSFLFSELCTRAYSYPDKVRNGEEVEHRLNNLGASVGPRLLILTRLRTARSVQPVTVDDALRFLSSEFWLQWFGKAADGVQRESNSDRFFVLDSDPVVLEHVSPTPDCVDREGRWNVNYASFMGGIAQGVLEAMGFACEVLTYHQPEPGKPRQSLFAVSFEKAVMERERM